MSEQPGPGRIEKRAAGESLTVAEIREWLDEVTTAGVDESSFVLIRRNSVMVIDGRGVEQ